MKNQLNRIFIAIFGLLFAVSMAIPATASAQVTQLACSPGRITTTVGGDVELRALGGGPTFNWVTENRIMLNIGSVFVVDFDTPGIHVVHVTSQYQTAFCVVEVLGSTTNPSTGTPTTPQLPNTGAGSSLVYVGALIFLAYVFSMIAVSKKTFAYLSK